MQNKSCQDGDGLLRVAASSNSNVGRRSKSAGADHSVGPGAFMQTRSLQDKRVLVTHAHAFMGPVLCEVFASHGATVVASTESLLSAGAIASIVAAAERVDILVVNLAMPASTTAVTQVSEEEWNDTFAALVHPLPRLFQAVLPSMIERRTGKILVMGSASALRGRNVSMTLLHLAS